MTVQTQMEAKLKQLRLKCNAFPALQSLEVSSDRRVLFTSLTS